MSDASIRAVVVDQPGDADTLRVRAVDAPRIGPGEVLVGIEAAGVNPVDTGNRADPTWARLSAPYVVGYEFAGRVLELDKSVKHPLRVGDPVWGMLPVRGTTWGAYAEQITARAELVAPMPTVLEANAAAVLPIAGCTALQVLDRMSLNPGSWLLIHGASGGVGHLLVQLARSRGIRVAAATRRVQRERVVDLGVELWLDRTAGCPAARAAAELGHDLDGAADLVGGFLPSSLPFLREGAQAAAIVDLDGNLETAIDRNITIHGVLVRPGRQSLAQLADAVDDGLRVDIAATFPLADAAIAHRRLEAGAVGGKIVLTVG